MIFMSWHITHVNIYLPVLPAGAPCWPGGGVHGTEAAAANGLRASAFMELKVSGHR